MLTHFVHLVQSQRKAKLSYCSLLVSSLSMPRINQCRKTCDMRHIPQDGGHGKTGLCAAFSWRDQSIPYHVVVRICCFENSVRPADVKGKGKYGML